ncbi:cell division protein FtsX [Sutcliffiella cohnii]|uniref:Cell division protein FtsX n=1 Tax=Sutcliffiella cohnii TaxID=33932 RepID=A0A223KNA2_9BACI|nr:ABC transporter permease [Sutcliffiella cohnii]AST90877.1 cell division protein FtsX [Sutcliffiella cohnii]
MNIVNKLTVRHLKENKRRTLVTIIGVIISVAMITAVATLGVSFLDLLKRQSIADEGHWHVVYKEVHTEQIEAIKKDEHTKELILSRDLGYAALNESQNENKPYVFIKQYNEQGFKNFPIELKEGRLPKSENEIVISHEIKRNAKVDYQIGDELTFDVGNRWTEATIEPLTQTDSLQRGETGVIEEIRTEIAQTYTVVGIIERPTWEPTWSPGYTIINYIDEKNLTENETVNAIVVVNKVNRSIYKNAEKLAEKLDIPSKSFNNELLRYYGVTNVDTLHVTLYSLCGIIMGIIIIGSISLIYNAFAISVSERARHLGMLASVGATKKQKRNSVFFEGIIIGGISIPIGIVSGIAGIGVTFYFINTFINEALNTTESLSVVVTPMTIFVACFVSALTIFLSTYIPARKASKVSAIDAIRQTEDVKLTGKKVKTSKLVRKLFGIEAEIGLKNLKRNKRRYQATVFSLVISIVLFLTVAFFTSNLQKSVELSQDNINFDIQISGSNTTVEEDLRPLMNVDFVTESTLLEEVQLHAWIEENQIAEELKQVVKEDPSVLEDGKYPYYVEVIGLDEESYEAYAKEVGVNIDSIHEDGVLPAIVIDQVSYKDYDLNKVIETKTIHTTRGESIDLFNLNYETGERSYVNSVTIAALTDKIPMGVHTAHPGGLNIIVSASTLGQLLSDGFEGESYKYLYLSSSNPMATQEAIEEVKSPNLYVYNIFKNRQQSEQVILLMSVFTYGFIVLISAISVANIFNTISTSISLRKREFAMLKSVGMTPSGFNRMMNYESIFYGLKALLYGLPISIVVMILMYLSFNNTFEYGFSLPWLEIIFVIIAIFVIVGSSMLYSIKKVKKQNIIEGLKQENI